MRKIGKNLSFLIPVIACAVIMVFMAGCEKITEKNKAIISHFYEEIHKGNLEIIEETLDTNCVLNFPIGVVLRGPDGYKEHILAPYLNAFPDSKHVIEDMIAEGDKVVARFTVPGTHKGEFMGINPTGKQATFTSVAIYRIVNDKFVEIWCEYDALGLMQQLGVIPAEGREDFTWGKPSEVTGVPGDPEENKAIARRHFEEVWNQGNLDVINEIFAADYVGHQPGGPDIHGPEGLKQFVTMHRTAFPDIQFTVEDQIAEGDKVVIRWKNTITHKGELMGIPPTGRQATQTGISFFRIAGGKIVERWLNRDALGMLQQLGVIPPMGQGEE